MEGWKLFWTLLWPLFRSWASSCPSTSGHTRAASQKPRMECARSSAAAAAAPNGDGRDQPTARRRKTSWSRRPPLLCSSSQPERGESWRALGCKLRRRPGGGGRAARGERGGGGCSVGRPPRGGRWTQQTASSAAVAAETTVDESDAIFVRRLCQRLLRLQQRNDFWRFFSLSELRNRVFAT